jgi:hypothetical protein
MNLPIIDGDFNKNYRLLLTEQAIIVWTFQSILNSWIPVFTGMTENKTCPKIVTPAKAGVQCGVFT